MENSLDQVLTEVKDHFINTFSKADRAIILYEGLVEHVKECVRWAEKFLGQYPEADYYVVIASVWLHAIGQSFAPKEEDHAVKSEKEAIRLLRELGCDEDFILGVAHCVRSHRNKDVPPQTLEAKILAAADSASHFTDVVYIDMAIKKGAQLTLEKIERDYRDSNLLPSNNEQLEKFYVAWKNLINLFAEMETSG